MNYIDIEEPDQALAPLDEENDYNNHQQSVKLSNVDELEISLGKVKRQNKSLNNNRPIPQRKYITQNDDVLSKSLTKSKTPVIINKEENIDIKYHIYYERELGRGTKTIVRKAIERSTGKQFAVKTVQKDYTQETQHMRKEIDLLSDVNHYSIINLYAAYEDEDYLHMIMDECKGGELYQYVIDRVKTVKNANTGVKESKATINEKTAAAIVRKVVDSVAYLHEHNIVHRDLKLENILFLSKHKPFVKVDATMDTDIRLIDFGLSKRYDTHRSFGSLSKLQSFVGTNSYIAPEVLEAKDSHGERGYTHHCDIWSIGILAYALLSAKPPFYGNTDSEIFASIKKGEYTFPSSDWDGISEEAKDFIRSILVKDESYRPSAISLRSHPWIKDALKLDNGVTKKAKGGFFKKVLGIGGKKKK